jgi:iron complex transport system substrate-binding protein
MLYALGAGKQVVGVDEYSTYPPNAPRTKFTGAETNAEDYLSLKPDLVIVAYESGKVVQQLQLLKIPALVLPPAATFADVYSQLTELGTATGHQAGARRVESSMQEHLSLAVHAAGGAGRGETYYFELDPTYYTATSKTFIGAEFSLFGMTNIANAAGRSTAYPQISAEYLLKQDPDYVFLADTVCCHQDVASFAHRPGFNALVAVQRHHVITVNDSVASQWGPHTIETFVSLLAGILHP